MSSNHSPSKRQRILIEGALSTDLWKVIYEYLDKEDLGATQQTSKEHFQGITQFVRELVDSTESSCL